MDHDIGEVAVDKQLAGQQADDFIGRHTAVGAAYPQVGGRLLGRQPGKELRILLRGGGGPFAVVLE